MSDYLNFDALCALVGADDARRLLRHAYLTGNDGRPVLERTHAEELMLDLDGPDEGEGLE
jgi:hypothetical protein